MFTKTLLTCFLVHMLEFVPNDVGHYRVSNTRIQHVVSGTQIQIVVLIGSSTR